MEKHEKQALWSSKTVFILAAIGSAAGLGNLWKFPYLVYDNGGLAFIIAYIIMLLFVGLGLLIGEISLGQKERRGLSGSLGHISKNLKWVGWSTVGFAFLILSYYIVVIGWGIDYLYYSLAGLFSGSLAWAGDGSGFFFGNILGITDGISDKGSISTPILLGTLFSLILVYFFTYKSAKSVGKVILVTATLPFVTLFLLAIRGLTLPNASEGLNYLLTLDSTKLFSFSTWTAAGGQIFFTLSVAMGVMVAYGSMKKEESEIVKATVMVALGNTLISFLSAITVFGTLGYLAGIKGVPVTEVVKGGPSLVFVTIPETLTHFSSFSVILSIVFFLTVFLLAIDSAMSLVEAVTVPIKNKFKKYSIEVITLVVTILVGLSSLIYMYGNGLYILDIIDHYITQLGILVIGFIELGVFIYAYKSLRDFIKSRNHCILKKVINGQFFLYSWIFGIMLIGILIGINIKSGYMVYDTYIPEDLFYYGILPVILVFLFSIIINFIKIKD